MNERMRNEAFIVSKNEQEQDESLWSIMRSELDLLALYFDPLEDVRRTEELINLIGAKEFVNLFSHKLSNLDLLSTAHTELLYVIAQGGAQDWVIGRIGDTVLNLNLQVHRNLLKGIAYSGTQGASWVLDHLGERRLNIERDNGLIIALHDTGARSRLYEYLDRESIELANNDVRNMIAVLAAYNAEWVCERFGDKLDIASWDHEYIFVSAVDGGGLEWVEDRLQAHAPLSPDFFTIAETIAKAGHGEWLTHIIDPASIKISQPTHVLLLAAIARNGGAAWVEEQFKEQLQGSTLSLENIWRINIDNGAPFPSTDQDDLVSIKEKEKGVRNTARENIIDEFTRALGKISNFCSLEDDVVDELKNRVLGCIEKLSDHVIPFLNLSLRNSIFSPTSTFFSHFATSFFDSLEQGTASRALRLKKQGSELTLLIQPREVDGGQSFAISFVNDIAAIGAESWQRASQKGIPVAPMLSEPAPRPYGMTRVYSRYCGTTLAALTQLANPTLNAFLFKKRQEILIALEREGISHGHPHDQNFTVEFIEKKWLDAQLAEGKTINTLPAQSGSISFDVIDFLKNPEQFVPVVRLIDWDAARQL